MSTTLEAPPTHTGTMHTLNESGDTRISWDASQPTEVDAARLSFNALTKNGKYTAFRGGRNGSRMDAFDPNAKEILLVPQIAGG